MFIGRDLEIAQIQRCLKDQTKAQMIVLYGRRRIGKSRLIKEATRSEKNLLFFEGLEKKPSTVQIDQFLADLSRQTKRIKLAAKNWREVFQGLEETIRHGRWVVVIDELPWLACERTSLISDLKLFWDRWSVQNPRIVLFLCGSIAQFMVKHLVHSKSLHNRKTLELCVNPLLPKEAGEFVSKRGLFEKSELYMIFGGIPKYLEQIDPTHSVDSNINSLCFTANGFFTTEFETIFKEQFRSTKYYSLIIEELSRGRRSLSDLSRILKIEKGGGLKSYLDNLRQASFIKEYTSVTFGMSTGSKTKQYKLTDPFLKFYFHFIKPNRKIIALNKNENLFKTLCAGQMDTYYGLQFERLCEESLSTILEKLKLSLGEIKSFGPYFQQRSSFHQGAQFDLVIECRQPRVFLFELKYTKKPVGLNLISEMENKIHRLKISPSVTVEKVLISAAGASPRLLKAGYFDHILTLTDLLRGNVH